MKPICIAIFSCGLMLITGMIAWWYSSKPEGRLHQPVLPVKGTTPFRGTGTAKSSSLAGERKLVAIPKSSRDEPQFPSDGSSVRGQELNDQPSTSSPPEPLSKSSPAGGSFLNAEASQVVQVKSRTLVVPAALAHRPLPVFIRHLAGEVSVLSMGNIAHAAPGRVIPLAKEKEEQALQEAERIFTKAMLEAPAEEVDAQEYENWWRSAQERGENYLRLALGWDRFTTLTREEMTTESARFEGPQGGALPKNPD